MSKCDCQSDIRGIENISHKPFETTVLYRSQRADRHCTWVIRTAHEATPESQLSKSCFCFQFINFQKYYGFFFIFSEPCIMIHISDRDQQDARNSAKSENLLVHCPINKSIQFRTSIWILWKSVHLVGLSHVQIMDIRR